MTRKKTRDSDHVAGGRRRETVTNSPWSRPRGPGYGVRKRLRWTGPGQEPRTGAAAAGLPSSRLMPCRAELLSEKSKSEWKARQQGVEMGGKNWLQEERK